MLLPQAGLGAGLGKEIVRGLAENGYEVLLGARSEKLGKEAAVDLASVGMVHFLQLDVTSEVSIEAAAQEVKRRYGHLDVLVSFHSMRSIS